MPRIARLTFPGGFYHIFNRGLNKNQIFHEDKDYERLLEILNGLLRKGDWCFYAYCLMPNHYHFLVEEKRTPIAKLMGRLFTSYSLYFNKKYNRQGPLFQDRFKSKLVQKESYFLEVSRYIHLNPYKSAMTKNPEEYKYSSLREYLNNSSRKIIDMNKIIILLGDKGNRIENYLKFIKDGMNLNLDEYDPYKNNNDLIGNPVFATHRKMKAFSI